MRAVEQVYDPSDREQAKRRSREEDLAALRSGDKPAQVLRAENALISDPQSLRPDLGSLQ
jgi:hypothetical protein